MVGDDTALDGVLDELCPFDRSVVQLRYQGAQSVASIANTLTSTTGQVGAALMDVYRRVAAALETPAAAEPA